MYPDHFPAPVLKPARLVAQRGFALASAIFLVVVLAALGAFMVQFSGVQHATSAQDIQGVRAYHAARAGIEWAAYRILKSPGAGFEANCQAAGGTTQALAAMPGTLSGFGVTVSCTATSHSEGADTIRIYRIISTASLTGSAPGQSNYVERQLQLNIER
ncbi:hypothetical protein [Janthinobacterium sp. 17J80-10]|uniref:hypothetical protein n=1 Tax=Janthinobacterium sp. 17J80-10 TaxID=2497863 RepID=UPI0010056A63|nr:hypothetical protein [Janthinobacterium sp. 17J80-10]QAU36039.1 hypothetical protein EKL02_08835 [Janthinobacterium sp. 17J80-10]